MGPTDIFVMACVAFGLIACTVFAFVFGAKDNAVGLLTALGGIVSILAGTFHWLYVRDSKLPDAPHDGPEHK